VPVPAEDRIAHELLETAAAHATARVPVARPAQAVGEVRTGLAGQVYECADDIAVLDGAALVGVVPIERLLGTPAEVRIQDVMDSDPPVVAPGEDQEVAAWKMVNRGESSIAVVDGAGRFLGLIPPHRMLSVLLAEHDEDLARLGGYLAGTAQARQAAEERISRRLWHRLPWLLIGLLGAMASAVIVGAFEHQLEEKVLLVVFVPAVVYMADAVGTQTEAVVIRGLSVGVKLRPILGRELLTGLMIGLAIGVAFFCFALLAWDDARVAVAVALALVASCSIATILAMALPWTFQRFGSDPAFGSGPLATVVQDLVSIAVYLGIATLIAT
jgi:magnesium transporter